MRTELFELAGRQCMVYKNERWDREEKYLIVQAVDKAWIGKNHIETEVSVAHKPAVGKELINKALINKGNTKTEIAAACIQEADKERLSANGRDIYEHTPIDIEAEKIFDVSHSEIIFANFGVANWNNELSPWSADAVFKNQPFRGNAENTLNFVKDIFIPELVARYSLPSDIKIVIGGYSLAGLFSLWAAYRTDIFHAVAAVSPSVWFPGWIEFAAQNHICADNVYLSLGNREEKTNNKVMAKVGENIRLQKNIFDTHKITSILEWNEGNHFKNVEERVAKGMLWVVG